MLPLTTCRPRVCLSTSSCDYAVWKEVWKPHEDKPHKFQNKQHWEFNYSDLTAIPFGVFSNQKGRPLVGCARLVLPKANETEYAETIRSLVEDKPTLKKRLDASNYDHPYDMFEPFEGFMDYYHNIRGIKRAEVSRVIVAQSWRSLCIGEALMDRVADFARSQGFQQLFLACERATKTSTNGAVLFGFRDLRPTFLAG